MHESDIMAVGSGGFYEIEWMWSLLISGLLLLTVEKKILGLNSGSINNKNNSIQIYILDQEKL